MRCSERAEVHATAALEAAGQLDDDCGGFSLYPEFVLAKARSPDTLGGLGGNSCRGRFRTRYQEQ
jgi:hypothetical protein